MKTILRIASVAMLFTVAAFAQDKSGASDDAIQVKQLERAWNQAEARHDAAAVTNIVADTLTYIDFDGSMMNKADYVKDVTNTAYQADHLFDEKMDVRVYGTAAVVVGIYRETGTSKGKAYVHRVRFTDMWIKQAGVWHCVASQNTLIQ